MLQALRRCSVDKNQVKNGEKLETIGLLRLFDRGSIETLFLYGVYVVFYCTYINCCNNFNSHILKRCYVAF